MKKKAKNSKESRPEFAEIKSYNEFMQYYWFRQELVQIAQRLYLDNKGTKQELNQQIKDYFNGLTLCKPKQKPKRLISKKVSLDCPLLECDFSFNKQFRHYFSELTGISNFKFTADMAAAWRKVKADQDYCFTVQDMLDIYYNQSDYAEYDSSVCQWNRFYKEFCADEKSKFFNHKLKTAAILWSKVRDSAGLKLYSSELIEKYWDSIKQYSINIDTDDT